MDTKSSAEQFITALHNLERGTDESGVGGIVELFAEDAELVNTALLLGGETLRGKKGATEFWTQYKKTIGVGKSDFHHITLGESAAGLFWKTAIHDGATQYDGSTLLDFDDSGKIRYFQGYYDTRQLNHAVGVEGK